jgi:hypothetical protein
MDRTGNNHVKWNKPDWERQVAHVVFQMWIQIWKNKINDMSVKQGTVWGWEPVGGKSMKEGG